MMHRILRPLAAAVLAGVALAVLLPEEAAAQKALVYCPAEDDTGCSGVAAALAGVFPDGVDRGADGSGGTVDLSSADLGAYSVFLIPSLADDETVRPYAKLREAATAERLRSAVTGRIAVWSGTPDLGTSNRDKKDALIRNLGTWARANASEGRGAGLVALLDASASGRYDWLAGIAGVSLAAGDALDVYANVEVKTATGTTLLSSGGLQLGYTSMALGAITSAAGTVDATGGRTTNPVLLTFAGGAGSGIATITTDKEDYAPGETVTITGTGWEPGETVAMELHEEPLVHGDRTLTAVADSVGNIFNDTFKPEEHDLGVRFVLTAVGQTSGRTAQTTFTDDRTITAVTVNGGSTVTVLPAGSTSVTVTATTTTTGGGGEAWLSTSYRIATTPPPPSLAGMTCVDTPDNTSAGTHVETFTATAPSTPGTYNLYVAAWRTASCANNASNVFVLAGAITVQAANQPPVPDAGGPYGGNEGSAVSLNGASVTDDGPAPLTYAWSYAAGAGVDAGASCSFAPSNTVLQPTVTCTDDGTFTLTLAATDGAGASASDNATLTLQNVAPVANAGGPYSGAEGAAIPLLGSGTDAGANDVAGLTHTWTVNHTGIDASGSCTIANPTQANTTVTCTDDGSFAVSLVVGDGDGGTSSTSNATLSVSNVAPVASAGGPYSGLEGAAIAISGSATDAGSNDQSQLTYQWTADVTDIDGGGSCSFGSATSASTTVTCTDDGVFAVRLVATDDDGGVSTAAQATLTVGNAAPVADAGGDYTGNEGSPVSLDGSVEDAGANDSHTWSWAYVDGSGIDGGTCTFSDPSIMSPTVTCTDDGVVQLTLTVTDDDGAEHSDQATLTLANVDPVADAGGGATSTYTGVEGSAVPLNGSVTDAGANDTHTWSWEYLGTSVDPGATCSFSSATAEDPTITCTDDGTVQLTLTVTDDDGGSDEDTATLVLTNAPPVAAAGGPYTGTEGAAIQLAGSATDAGTNDVLTYLWTVDAGGIDGGGSCSFDDAADRNAKLTCTDNGTASLTLTVTDDDGGSDTDVATVNVANAAPVANAGGPYSGNEGQAVSLAGSATDAGANDVLSYLWSYTAGAGVDAGASCSFAPSAGAQSPSVTCTDDGTYALTLTVSDDDGGAHVVGSTLALANVAPVLAAITAPLAPVAVGSPVAVSATFSDLGANDTHTGAIVWGDGTTAAAISGSGGSGTASGTHVYTAPGVYTIEMSVTDDDGGVSNESVFQYVVVYDPNGGFVTGGGWIASLPGMYLPDPSLGGKANFGFVSKYLKGATIPTGNTEFQFHAGDLNFKSSSYEWLVVQGKEKASYKGVGTINGTGNYGFLLSVWDGGTSGDRFRIKVWDVGSGNVVYDNQPGSGDDATATTALGGGSIVVHTAPGKVASK